jgi:hypothetical protein
VAHIGEELALRATGFFSRLLGVMKGLPQAGLSGLSLTVCATAIQEFPVLANGALCRWHNAGESRLEHVVCCASLECTNGQLLTDGARDENKRQIRPCGAHKFQGCHAIERRQPVVCQHKIGTSVSKLRPKRFLAVHTDDFTWKGQSIQLPANQAGIDLIILQH